MLLKLILAQPVKGLEDLSFHFNGNAAVDEREGVFELVTQLLAARAANQPNNNNNSNNNNNNSKGGSIATSAPNSASASNPAVGSTISSAPSAPPARENKTQKAVRQALEGLQLSAGDARRRATLLAGDAALKALYDELVVKKQLISEDDFWKARQAELDLVRATTSSQLPGAPSALISDVKPSMVKPGEVHYRLTVPMIRQIFAERPAVRRAYDDNVPHKLSEVEFWTEYLQSKYVEAAAARPRSATAGDIFTKGNKQTTKVRMQHVSDFFLSAAEADLEAEERNKEAARISTTMDLRDGEGEPLDGFEDAEEPVSFVKHGISTNVQTVIDRLNAHGALVLDGATQAYHVDGSLDDLVAREKLSVIPLHLSRKATGAVDDPDDANKEDDGGVRAMDVDDVDPEQKRRAFLEFLQKEDQPNNAPLQPFDFSQHLVAVKLENALRSANASGSSLSKTEEDAKKIEWTKTLELLRHYWGCFPLRTPQAVQKAKRIRDALLSLPKRESRNEGLYDLSKPVQAALNHAAKNVPQNN